ncbi:MAG: hypothetical protein JNJ88_12955 [Planctomycetes bacterium]|nr:hypothetical protein [Planctomycetota bacterium]
MNTTTTLSSFALGCLLVASPSNPWHTAVRQGAGDARPRVFLAAATISVNSELGPDAQNLSGILSDNGFLASIHSRLEQGALEDLDDAGKRATINVQNPGSDLLAIRVWARSREEATEILDSLLTTIPKLESNSIADARERAERAGADVKAKQEKLTSCRAALQASIEEHGTMPPSAELSRVQNALMIHSEELEQLRFEVATRRALNDVLKTELERVPETIVEKKTIRNPRRLLLESQYEALLKAKPPVNEGLGAAAGPQAYIDKLWSWLEPLEKQLSSPGLEDRVVEERVPNARRAEIEQQLFDGERELASQLSRELVLTKRVQELQESARRLWRLDAQRTAVEQAVDRASNELTEAENREAEAQAEARNHRAGAWIRVVAGPRIDE